MGLAEMDSRNWTSLIDDIVAGDFYDAEAGKKVSVPYESIVFEQSLDGREEALVARLKLGDRLAVVADEQTYDALGARVARARPLPVTARFGHPLLENRFPQHLFGMLSLGESGRQAPTKLPALRSILVRFLEKSKTWLIV